MKTADALAILSGQRRDPLARLLRLALVAPAAGYGLAMRARRWGYRRGWLPARRASLPVICVGNLTTGGTGKTPMVRWVLQRLIEAGRTPAVLTRGYAAGAAGSDEARWLAGSGAAVVVNADRAAGAEQARRRGADVAVMDDGFQHLRLGRDLDIVLVDATCPFGYGWPLPRGLLRETPAALADAGAVVLTRSDAVAPARREELTDRLARLARGATLAWAEHAPLAAIGPDGQRLGPEALAGRSMGAFCGLGNPRAFFATLRGLGVDLAGELALDDHAAYGPADLEAVAELGGSALVTTEKDHLKLPPGRLGGREVWQLAVGIEITRGREQLLGLVDEAVGQAPAEPAGR